MVFDSIKVENLRKTYKSFKNEPVKALKGISFSVKKGQVLGLLGPNGAGKTTAIKILCGLIIPEEGTVYIENTNILRNKNKTGKLVSAVLEGNRNIYWRLSVRENLDFFGGLYGLPSNKIKSRTESLLGLLKLEDKADTPARKLSRGMQQKLALACTLIKDTPVLLLDEPTLGVDVEMSRDLKDFIKEIVAEKDKTIIVSTHNMETVEDICDEVVILKKGKFVTQDSIDNLKTLFGAAAYEFEIAGILTNDQKNQLRNLAPLLQIDENKESSKIRVELLEDNSFYEVIECLEPIPINSVDKVEPDLEEIFLELIKK